DELQNSRAKRSAQHPGCISKTRFYSFSTIHVAWPSVTKTPGKCSDTFRWKRYTTAAASTNNLSRARASGCHQTNAWRNAFRECWTNKILLHLWYMIQGF